MKLADILLNLKKFDHQDTAMRYVWRCGNIVKSENIEVNTRDDLYKLGRHTYKLGPVEDNFGPHRFLTIEWAGETFWFHLHKGMMVKYEIL